MTDRHPSESDPKEQIAALLEEAKASLVMQQYTVARTLLEQVLAQDPSNRDALYYMATIYTALRKPEQAFTYLEQLLDRYPDDQAAQNLLSKLRRTS